MITRAMSDNSAVHGHERSHGGGEMWPGGMLTGRRQEEEPNPRGSAAVSGNGYFGRGSSRNGVQPANKNMYINKSLTSLCCIAPALAFSVLLAGCNKSITPQSDNGVSASQPGDDGDTSKPGNTALKTAIQDLYGSCPLWTFRDVQRIDGAAADDGQSYAVASRFVLVLNDPARLQRYVVQPDGRVLASVEELSRFDARPDFKDCNLRVIAGMAINAGNGPDHHIAAAYQVQEVDAFVQSERGWHLMYTNTTGINFSADTLAAQDIKDVEPTTLTEDQAASSTVASSQSEVEGTPSGSAGPDARASAGDDGGDQSIFHRLNLLVLSLFRHGDATHEQTSIRKPTTTEDVAVSESAPATADVASRVTPDDNVAPAPAPALASVATSTSAVSAAAIPAASASVPPEPQPAPTSAASLAVEAGASAAQVAVAATAPAAKLELLLRKAQAEFNSAQYRSSVATTEAILLLDPTNTPAQRLHDRALGLEKKQAAAPATKVLTSSPKTAQISSAAARPLAAMNLDGDWQGTYRCGPYTGSGSVSDPDAWTRRATLTIRNGQATLIRFSDGRHAYRETLSGNVAADLSLHLTGNGQYADSAHPWRGDFSGRFAGSVEQATYTADGELTNWRGEKFRDCHLLFSR